MSSVTEAVTFAYPDTLNKVLLSPLKLTPSIASFEVPYVGEAGEEIEIPAVPDIVDIDAPSHFQPAEPFPTFIEYGMYSLTVYACPDA